MGKETKIGLGIIGSLLVVLVIVLVKKMSGPATAELDPTMGADAKTPAATPTSSDVKPLAIPKKSQPTMLKTNAGASAPQVTAQSKWQTAGGAKQEQALKPSLKSPSGMGQRFSAAASKGAPKSGPASTSPDSDRYGARFRVNVADSADENSSKPFNPFSNQPPEPRGEPSLTPPRQLSADSPAQESAMEIAGRPTHDRSRISAGDYRGRTSSDNRLAPAAGASTRFTATEREYDPTQQRHESGQRRFQLGGDPTPQRQLPAQQVGSRPYERGTRVGPTGSYSRDMAPARGRSIPSQDIRPVVATRENTGKYFVEPGDTFWTISEKLYGSGGFFKALQEHNRGRIPVASQLDVGDEILTPTADELREKYSGLCPKVRKTKPGTPQVSPVSTQMVRGGREYLVEEGDTLYDIARYELGDAGRWPEIRAINLQKLGPDMDYLRPGTVLILPSDEPTSTGGEGPVDVLTRDPRPSPTYQR